MNHAPPVLCAVTLDTTNARGLAEFYRALLGFTYATGDEPPAPGQDDPKGRAWLVLLDETGRPRLAFQQVPELAPPTWRSPEVPQQLHLDLAVESRSELDRHHRRAIRLGARLLEDRSEDAEESLLVLADPSGHPFCLLVAEAFVKRVRAAD